MPVPPPIMPFAYAIFSPDSVLGLLQAQPWTRTLTYHPEHARLVTVVAAKITDNQRNPDPSVLTDTLHLDIETTVDISDAVADGHLQWTPPSSGEWQIISIYTMPSGSHTLISAELRPKYVTDPFDTEAITRYYEGWIGKHPELLAHAGKTLRALFSDSYEYFAQRFFSEDLLAMFEANRGYDVTSFLPAVFHPAKDQHFFFFTRLQTAPDFSYGELSARIIHDFNLTVSDLFFKHWYPVSRKWIEAKNLLFRQQGYNPPLDIIRAAGAASIPETEGGNELWLKRVASGGHLYGRPLITAESFVFFPQGGFALSPQEYKQGIDLLMTAGVNQIIYHGTPYKWDEPGYGEIGWSPFISPAGSNISTTISEADSFWKYQHIINTYAARLQFLLQQGQPEADVLVYLPIFDDPADERFTPVLQALDANGYTWEWINDDLIQNAEWTDKRLNIGNMTFNAVILPDIPALPVQTAEKLSSLAKSGLPVIVYGQTPAQQPGFHNYIENDATVKSHSQEIIAQSQCSHTGDSAAFEAAITQIEKGTISYTKNASVRLIRRKLDDGQIIAFLRNTSGEETTIQLQLDAKFSTAYWLDATTGSIHLAEQNDTLTAWLPGFGTIALLCSEAPVFSEDALTPGNPVQKPTIMESLSLDDWALEVSGDDVPGGNLTITENALLDWSQHETLKTVSSPGVYTTTVHLDTTQADKRYLLTLGKVFSAADVAVNKQHAGSTIFSPYQVDITDFLNTGDNKITVTVTPALKNRLLGKALAGDPEYAQFGRSMFGIPQPISAGLVGSVNLQVIES